MKKLYLVALTIAFALFSGCQNNDKDLSAPNPDRLKIISWGDQYQDSQEIAIFAPYREENPSTDITVVARAGGALNKLRNKHYTRSSQWDVVDMIGEEAITACEEGLLVKLDNKDVFFGEDLLDQIRQINGLECAVPNIAFSTAFAYRSHGWGGRKPSSIRDFFDLKRFPGKRSLQKSVENNLVWALIADRVSINNVYELLETEKGLDRAFRKLNTIKKHTLWWEDGKSATNWLASEKVVFASAYNARIFQAITTNKDPIEYFWDWQALDLDVWVIPQTSVRQIQAKDFIDFATNQKILNDQARHISYGPVRISAAQNISDNPVSGVEMAKYSPTSPQNLGNHFFINHKFWKKNRERLQNRFDEWLAE